MSGDDVSFTGQNAVSFTNFPFVQINNLGGPPVFTVTGVGQTLNVDITNTQILAGFKPFFAATSGAAINITLHGSAILGSTPGTSPTVLTVDGTSRASITALDRSRLVAGAVVLASGGTLTVRVVDSARVDDVYFTTTGVTVILLSIAPEVAYTPATPTDWSPPPTQVAQALDQLAARAEVDPQQLDILTTQIAALFASNAKLASQVAALQQEQTVILATLRDLEAKSHKHHCHRH